MSTYTQHTIHNEIEYINAPIRKRFATTDVGNTSKQDTSEAIKKLTSDFIASGGIITAIDIGVSKEYIDHIELDGYEGINSKRVSAKDSNELFALLGDIA